MLRCRAVRHDLTARPSPSRGGGQARLWPEVTAGEFPVLRFRSSVTGEFNAHLTLLALTSFLSQPVSRKQSYYVG